MTVGKRLKAARIALGLSGTELCARLGGMHLAQISRYEHDRVPPSRATCDRLYRVLGVWLFHEPRTVRVRVAVAIDVHGEWKAVGWGEARDADVLDRVTRMLDDDVASVFWVETNVPVSRGLDDC